MGVISTTVAKNKTFPIFFNTVQDFPTNKLQDI